MAGFSGAIKLADMNDYLAPNQSCIAPLLKSKGKGAGAASGAAAEASTAAAAGGNSGTRVRVEMELSASDAGDLRFPGLAATGGAASSVAPVPSGGHFDQIRSDPVKKTATVSLNDCLACSGCITSAETVLITQQSTQEFINVLQANEALRAAAASAAAAAGDSAAVTVAPADAMSDVPSAAATTSASSFSQPRVVVVSVSPQSLTALAHDFGLPLLSCARKLNTFFTQHLKCDVVLDTSPAIDVALIEAREEFIARFKESQRKLGAAPAALSSAPADNTVVPTAASPLPVLTSECPGWVCYAEKTQGVEVLRHVSSVKSPQAILASWLKRHWAAKQNPPLDPVRIYHVTVMPCYDRKLEASRDDFFLAQFETRETDVVLTSGEVRDLVLERLPAETGGLAALPETELDPSTWNVSADGQTLMRSEDVGASGGYTEHLFRYAARRLFGVTLDPAQPLPYKPQRNPDYRELSLEVGGRTVLSFALAYGFRNIQNLVRKMKTKRAGSVAPPKPGAAAAAAVPIAGASNGSVVPPASSESSSDGSAPAVPELDPSGSLPLGSGGYHYVEVMACIAPATLVLLANGTPIRADQLRPSDLLLGDDGQAVAIVPNTLIGTVHFPMPPAPGAYPTPGVAGAVTRSGGWKTLRLIAATDNGFEPLVCSDNHYVTVGVAERATQTGGTFRRASAWHFPADCVDSTGQAIPGYPAAILQRGGFANIRPYAWVSMTESGPLYGDVLTASAFQVNAWNEFHGLDLHAIRVGDIQAQEIQQLPPTVQTAKLKLVKYAEPLVFPPHAWLPQVTDAAMADSGLPTGIVAGQDYSAVALPRLRFRAATLVQALLSPGDVSAAAAAARRVLAEAEFRDAAKPTQAIFPPTAAELAGLSAAAALDTMTEYIVAVTAWVIGLWVADGDGFHGMYVWQSLQTQWGLDYGVVNDHSGVFQRCRHWVALLGLPASFFRVVPAGLGGGASALPASQIAFHPLPAPGAGVGGAPPVANSVLRHLLLRAQLLVVGSAGAANKQRVYAADGPVRLGLQNAAVSVRLYFLAGLIDGDGWRLAAGDTHGFTTVHRGLADWVCLLFRQAGFNAASPRAIPYAQEDGTVSTKHEVNTVIAHFDHARRLVCACAHKRTVGRGFRRSNPFLSAFEVRPAAEAGLFPVVQFQLANASQRYLLADGTITHNCPSGCLNGGGQLRPPGAASEGAVDIRAQKQLVLDLDRLFHEERRVLLADPTENAIVRRWYGEWLGGAKPYTAAAREMLHTQYHAIEKELANPLGIKW